MTATPWRYPGGKSRLASKISDLMPPTLDSLVEPFVGGGGATMALLPHVTKGSRVVLNDADPRVAAWWSVVIGKQAAFGELLERLEGFTPTVAAFQRLQRNSLRSGRLVDRAFAAIAINRCAYSGILDAGPIGGKGQKSAYDVGCRYNPTRLVSNHEKVRAALLDYEVIVTSEDYRKTLANHNGFVYADPPYVVQGTNLYPTTFDRRDHEELADLVTQRESWAVSYDDDPWVRERYAEHQIHDLSTIYSVNSVIKGPRARRVELLVVP